MALSCDALSSRKTEMPTAASVYLMISATLGQEEPTQPVCSGALLPVWSLMTADQASISSMAFLAYRWSRVTYQASAWVYGDRVLALVGAAVVGVGVRAALDRRARLGRAVTVGVFARDHPVESTLPRLGPGVDLDAGEVDEGGGSGLGGFRGPREDAGDEGGHGGEECGSAHVRGLPFSYVNGSAFMNRRAEPRR
jgi:hypothetical protein